MEQFDNSMLLELNKGRCSWVAGYGAVAALCKEISARRVCEIGVAYGYHAESLLLENELTLYIGVDPYQPNYDPEDSFSRDVEALFSNRQGKPFDILFQTVAHRLNDRGNGVGTLLRMKSSEAAALFKDGTFDLIYIDGDHRPQAVYDDIHGWFSKVRRGGILCGDDVNWPGTEEILSKVSREFGCDVRILEWMGKREKWIVRC
jgi:hypothetical protein